MEELAIDVLNSDWHDWRSGGAGVDHLDESAWRRELCLRWRLDPALAANEALWQEVRALRQSLRTAVEHLGVGALEATDLDALNAVLEGRGWCQHLVAVDGAYRLGLRAEAVRPGAPGEVAWQTAASFARILVEGAPARLKRCDNPDCRWVFYDESRNQSRRWCEAATCGNLMKVRRFRARQRAQASGHDAPGRSARRGRRALGPRA